MNKYSQGSIFLHWFIALVVIAMLIVGFSFDYLPPQYKSPAFTLHKSTGITLLFLMVLRFFWVQITGKPNLPSSVSLFEVILSRLVQYGFYVLLILMSLTGWIMSTASDKVPVFFGLFKAPFPGITANKSLAYLMYNTHNAIAWLTVIFLCLHLAGALKHHFINKDDVLKQILP